MKTEALIVQWKEYRRDMKSLPVGSPAWKRTKQEMSDWIQSVTERFGQEVTNKVTKSK